MPLLNLEQPIAVRLDAEGRVVRTPAIERLLEEVRGLLKRDGLFSFDRAKLSTALELVDDEGKVLGELARRDS